MDRNHEKLYTATTDPEITNAVHLVVEGWIAKGEVTQAIDNYAAVAGVLASVLAFRNGGIAKVLELCQERIKVSGGRDEFAIAVKAALSPP